MRHLCKILTLLSIAIIVRNSNALAQTYTFTCPTTTTTWTVPAGCTLINVDVQGAAGGICGPVGTLGATTPGYGGRTQATLTVVPGQVLNIYVGGKGANGTGGGAAAGGFNGGGFASVWSPPIPTYTGGGGGGASDIRIGGVALANRVVVGGGGGGAGYDGTCTPGDQPGGNGGGLIGATAVSCDAYLLSLGFFPVNDAGGGTQTTGGGGALVGGGGYAAGTNGTLGNGGNNSLGGGCFLCGGGIGGGGGGGYYGGGGGCWMGGGGGSSYAEPTATGVIMTSGYNSGCGFVSITIACSPGTITGPGTTVCTGQTLSLTDATTGGVWSSTNTAAGTVNTSGVVTGIASGTTTISYTMPAGCAATYVVTVYAMPTPITGTLTVCQFATTPLGETVGGGSWGSSNTAVATVSGTGVVTGVAGGTSIVSYTTGGTCTQSVIVTVNAAPGAFTGTPNVCVGLTTTLGNAVGGGTWSSSNTAVGTISSPGGVLGGISGGTTTITYTMPGNCYSTEVATVNPAPSAIGGPTSVCQGSTITMTNTVGGGAWSSSNPGVGSIDPVTGVLTGLSGGTTTIAYTSTNCTPVTVVVTVNPVDPILGTPVVCTGMNITLSDLLAGTWSSSNTAVAVIGSSTGVLTGMTPGTSTIVFTFTTGCTTSVVATVNLSPVAISGTTTICQGNVATFSDLTPGGAWSSSNPGVGTIVAGSGVFTALTAGVTTISYIMAGTGCNATQVLTVNPVPAPISGTMSVCAGLSTTLTDATPSGTWSCTPPASIIAINPATGNVFGITAGTAIVSYTLSTGCYSIGVFTVNPSPQAILGSHSLCLGYCTPLSDLSPGGAWSSSNTAVGTIDPATGIACGVSTGTTVISYMLAAGCTSTTTITVNPNPTAVSGPTNGCIGFTATMTDATGGGTWSTSNNTVVNIGSSTGFLTATVPGTDTVFYTLNTGCWADMIFTVNPQPAAISGTPYVCVGLSETLSDLSGGGSWSASNANATIGSASGFVTGVTPGVDIITYTLPTTCYTTFPLTITTPPTAISGPDNVCVGSAITLSDGTTPGTWVLTPVSGNASISTSGVVTGISQGIVVVSYTTFSCNPVVYAVTVNPLPAPITGLGNVCFGATISLSDVTVGGTWSSSNSAAAVSSAGVVTGLSQGLSSTITYALPTGCFVTAPVSIDSIPKAIMGIDSVCPGSSVWLSDSTPGGVWSSTDGTIDSCFGFTGQVKGIRAGTVTISYKLITGCGVAMPFTVITPLPASMTMVQSPDPLVCDGDPVTFTVSPVNGGTPTYTWMKFTSIYLASGPSPSYTYNALHGDYITCIMTTGNICASPVVVEVSQVVNIYPNVIPSISISTLATSDSATYLGEVFTFYSNVTNGGINPTYQWYINNIPVSGATNTTFTTHVYNDNDTIYCSVNGNPPCETGSVGNSNVIILYGLGYLSVNSLNTASNNLSLFPNPNTGSFILSGILGTASNREVGLEAVDMLGRTVYTGTTTPQNGEIKAEIKLGSDAAAGTYLLRVFTETGTETFHFVIGK